MLTEHSGYRVRAAGVFCRKLEESVMSIGTNSYNTIQYNLPRAGSFSTDAQLVSGNLRKREGELLEQMSSPDPRAHTADGRSLQGDAAITYLQNEFKRAQRIWEMFQQMIESKHQMIMRLIGRISGR